MAYSNRPYVHHPTTVRFYSDWSKSDARRRPADRTLGEYTSVRPPLGRLGRPTSGLRSTLSGYKFVHMADDYRSLWVHQEASFRLSVGSSSDTIKSTVGTMADVTKYFRPGGGRLFLTFSALSRPLGGH